MLAVHQRGTGDYDGVIGVVGHHHLPSPMAQEDLPLNDIVSLIVDSL